VTGHLVVAVALVWWLLVSHVMTLHCKGGACAPLPENPTSARELGRYATAERCETVRATLAQVWPQLQAEVDRELPPQPEGLEMRTKGLSKIKLAIPCYTPGILMLEVCQWN
jgi:hypothetical protein